MADKNKISNPPNVIDRTGQNILSNFEGIFSLKPMAKYFSGARCVLRVNGKIVAFAFGISWNITTEATEVRTIDDYFPYELAPSRITVTGSITGFRIPGTGPSQEFLQANALSFLNQRYIEIEVRDSQTDNLIFYTQRAMVTSRSENVRSGNLAEMTLNFRAIGWKDEKEPTPPKPGPGGTVDVTGTSTSRKLLDKAKDVFNVPKL